MDVIQLALTWIGWPNGEKLTAGTGGTKVSAVHYKSMQVHAGPGQPESQVDPCFHLEVTCES